MLTDFFVAAVEDAAAIASGAFRAPDHSTNNADNSVLAALWGAIDASADPARLAGEDFLVAMGSDEGPWVFALPEEMTTSLSELPEAGMLVAADRWARSEELCRYGVSGSDMGPALAAVKRLAEQARSTDCRVLLRMAV